MKIDKNTCRQVIMETLVGLGLNPSTKGFDAALETLLYKLWAEPDFAMRAAMEQAAQYLHSTKDKLLGNLRSSIRIAAEQNGLVAKLNALFVRPPLTEVPSVLDFLSYVYVYLRDCALPQKECELACAATENETPKK